MNKPDLSIIIPLKNEAERLPETMREILSFMGTKCLYEILLIENGSTDNTYEVAMEFAEVLSFVRVLQSDPGKGAAVKLGMTQAGGLYRYMCDVDLSTPIESISAFVEAAKTHDIVIGSREKEGAERIGEPEERHSMGRVFNALVQIMHLIGIEDSQCGFKLFRWDVANDLFQHQTLDGFAFDVEILHLARRRGYSIHELPVTWTYDPDSRVDPRRDSWQMFWDLWKIRLNEARGVYGDLSRSNIVEMRVKP